MKNETPEQNRLDADSWHGDMSGRRFLHRRRSGVDSLTGMTGAT